MFIHPLTCPECGHHEVWEASDELTEHHSDYRHHWCGHGRLYRPCGGDCDHNYPGSEHRAEHIEAGEFALSPASDEG
jgi:hypothetical protein